MNNERLEMVSDLARVDYARFRETAESMGMTPPDWEHADDQQKSPWLMLWVNAIRSLHERNYVVLPPRSDCGPSLQSIQEQLREAGWNVSGDLVAAVLEAGSRTPSGPGNQTGPCEAAITTLRSILDACDRIGPSECPDDLPLSPWVRRDQEAQLALRILLDSLR